MPFQGAALPNRGAHRSIGETFSTRLFEPVPTPQLLVVLAYRIVLNPAGGVATIGKPLAVLVLLTHGGRGSPGDDPFFGMLSAKAATNMWLGTIGAGGHH